MSKPTIGAAIALDGEKEFKKAVSSINSDLKVLASEMNKVTSEFASNGNSVSALKAKSEQYNKQIEVQTKKIETLRAALENSQKNYTKAAENVDKWNKQLAEAKAELDRLKKSENATTEEIEAQEQAVAELSGKLKTAESNYEKAENKTKQWQISLNRAETELNKTQSELDDVNGKLKSMGKNAKYSAEELDDARDKLKSFSDSAKTAGEGVKKAFKAASIAVAAVGAAIGGVTAKSVSIGSEFEAQMSRVQAISGAVGNDFDNLTELAEELGASTAFSATQAAGGMENLASAGFNANQIMQAMPGLLDLAAVSGGDVAAASEVAASALNAFGLEASQAGHVANVFAKAAADTNAECVDMGEAMKYVAPVAKTMGMSIEETAAAIGIMSDAGVKGSQAGTTLRGALSRLAKPTNAMHVKMKQLGLSFYDAQGNMLPLEKQVAMLQKSFKGLSQEERNNALVTLYGQESLSGMLALIEAGPNKLNQLTTSFKNSDGAAKSMAETMQNNLNGQITILQSGLEGLAIDFYDGLQKPLTKGVKTITAAINNPAVKSGVKRISQTFGELAADIANFAARNLPKVISGFKKVASYMSSSSFKNSVKSVGSLFSSAGKVIATFGKITLPAAAKGFELLAKSGKVLIPVLAGAYTGFKAFKTITTTVDLVKKAKDAFAALNVVMAANPYAVAAAAIAAVGVALVGLAATCGETEDKYADLKAEIEANTESMKEMEEARKESYQAAYSEIYQVERLKERLSDLVDENGNVIGSKDELKNVIKKLNDYGFKVELNKTGDLIKNYKDLKKSIDDYIESKRLQAKLDSLDAEYQDAVSKADEYHGVTKNAKKAYEETYSAAKKVFKDAWGVDYNYDELIKAINRLSDDEIKIMGITPAIEQLESYKKAWEDAVAKEKQSVELMNAVEAAMVAQEKGNLDEANRILDEYFENRNASFKHAADYEKEQREKAISELGEQLKSEIALYKDALDSGSQDMINSQLEYIQKAADEFEKAGVTIPENLVEGIKSGEISVDEAMAIIAQIVENGAEIDLTTEGKAAGNSYADGIKGSKSTIKSAADSAGKTATNALSNSDLRSSAKSSGVSIGAAFAAGIGSGVTSNKYKAELAAKNTIKATGLAAKSTAQIHSPSRLMRDTVGKPLAEGIGVGIEAQSPKVAKQAVAATRKIMSSMQSQTKNFESAQLGYAHAANRLNQPSSLSVNSLPSDVLNLLISSSRPSVNVTNNNTFNSATTRDGDALIRQLNRALGANL